MNIYLKFIVSVIFILLSQNSHGKVIGELAEKYRFSAENHMQLKGWACEESSERSIWLHIYVGDSPVPDASRVYVKAIQAIEKSGSKVSKLCKTRLKSHRFTIHFTKQEIEKFHGKYLHVYGIGRESRNAALSKSGTHRLRHRKKQLIKDPHFKNGFNVKNPDGDYDGTLRAPASLIPVSNTVQKPEWTVSQWGSLDSINTNSYPVDKSTVAWGSPGLKRLELDASKRELTFMMNAINEYNDVYRTPTETRKWPHLLVEQKISNPYKPEEQSASLARMKSLNLTLDFQVLYQAHRMKPGFNPYIHVAQFVLYFTVQNLNLDSDGFGQYIWLGVPLYSSNHKLAPYFAHMDRDTRSMIYSIDQRAFMKQSPHNKEPMNINLNLLPHARRAVQMAFQQGIMSSGNLDDYKIGAMNTGYEITGLSVMEVSLKKLKLIQEAP